MTGISDFLAHGRHIFSICVGCGSVHRISELQLARKGEYKPDWLDKLESTRARWEGVIERLEDQKAELNAKAKQAAEKRELPRLLRKVVPKLVEAKVDPRDVRTLFDPVEFVVFDGMHKKNVEQVTLLSLRQDGRLASSIEETLRDRRVSWNTLRVGDDGSVTAKVGNKRGRPLGFDPIHDCPICKRACGNEFNLQEHLRYAHREQAALVTTRRRFTI